MAAACSGVAPAVGLYAPLGTTVTPALAARLASFVGGAGGSLAVLTGAGCSTESGIPDYRSPEGSYSKGHKPMLHADFTRNPSQRARYWARSLQGWSRFRRARPNAAHRALAALERAGYVSDVVTQNVDRLHQMAGSSRVVELHGNSAEVHCLRCGQRQSRHKYQREVRAMNEHWIATHLPPDVGEQDIRADGDAHLSTDDFAGFAVPPCGACGGVIMPSIVFFGGSLRPEVKEAALGCVSRANRLLILGSSCHVYSAYRLVLESTRQGMPTALVNIGETRADPLIDFRLPMRCGDALAAVCDHLKLGTDHDSGGAPTACSE